MPRKKAVDVAEEAKRVLTGILGEEKASELSSVIERYAVETGKTFDEIIREMIEAGARSIRWKDLTALDLIACVNLLNYIDSLFYRRVYVKSPIESVTEHAESYSKAIQRILEAQGLGLSPLIERVIEQKVEERIPKQAEQQKQERREQSENKLLEKAIDIIMSTIAEEIASRLGADLADKVTPDLREKIMDMVRRGEIVIKLAGEEAVKE